MANFVKAGRPIKDAQKRTERLNLRATPDEIELLDELMIVLNKRRHVELSRTDAIMYCLQSIYEKEDRIRVISKA